MDPCFALRYARPDEIAECWDGVPNDLYEALWALVNHYPTDTREYECPPEPGTNAVGEPALWSRLSDEHKSKLNALAVAQDAWIKAMIGGHDE